MSIELAQHLKWGAQWGKYGEADRWLLIRPGDHSGDSTGVTTVVEGRTCNGGERAAEGGDGDKGMADAGTKTDMNAVGIREGDKDDG